MAIPPLWKHAFAMIPHLIECAKQKRTITYSELSELIGHPAFFLGGPLDILRDDILIKHKLPRLDALVVNKETKEAGSSFYEGGRGEISDEDYHDLLEYERSKVYDYDRWDEVFIRLKAHYGVV